MTVPDPQLKTIEALNRLSSSLEQLEHRYQASQRANYRFKILLIMLFFITAVATYQAVSPVLETIKQLPHVFPQLRSAAAHNPGLLVKKKQQLMQSLSQKEIRQIEQFEKKQQWMSDYLALNPDFQFSATMALFLSQMSQSVQVMPDLYAEMKLMTQEMQSIRSEMQDINKKMSTLPQMANDMRVMNHQMTALPVMSENIKGMNIHIYRISEDLNDSIGKVGRVLPW